MSLQVWLPLNGNLNNQGLSDLKYTINTTPTYVNNGKIGKALALGQITMSAENTADILNNQEFSFCCWIYINADSGDTTNRGMLFGNDGMTAPNNRKFSIFQYPSCNDLHISWQNDTNTTFTGGVWSGYFPSYQWTHLAITYKNPTGTIYINGKQKSNFTGVSNSASFNFDTVLFSNCPNNGRYLNDYRIYDHCLSKKEVEEIAKGLILHYKLDNNGLGNPNLITTFDTSFLSYNDGAITLFTNQMNSGTQEIVSNINGAEKCVHFHSVGGSNRQYATLSVQQGKTYTISADYYSPVAQTTSWRGELNGGDYSWSPASANYTTPGQWQRLSYTYSNLTSNATIFFFTYCNSGTDCYIKNIKIEEGSIATPWSPGGLEAINIVYDSSGYNNNGTIIGTLNYLSDTPRYSISTQINGSKINCTSGLVNIADPIFTVALWFKLYSDTTYTSYQDLINFASTSYSNQPFRLEICGNPVGSDICWFRGPSGNTGGFKINNSALSFNTWYYTVLVSEGNKQYSFYLNGIKQGIYNGSANTWIPTGNVYIGDTITGKIDMSDFRIYETALTESQIKELYDTSATIDKDGNIYVREVIE